ncbi:hypothetical protein G3I24_26855, partial [Micromonospora aurantiaca]|nr:hypothetical protein [Micromonospora aurantiaca]
MNEPGGAAKPFSAVPARMGVGRLLVVLRLVVADVRRRPGQAAMLLVSITAATAMLSLGGSLHGATEKLYQQT